MLPVKVIVGTSGTSGLPEFGGSTWVRLQYVLGLQRLGVESYWVDRLGPINPFSRPHSLDYLMKRFHRTAVDFGFEDRYCVVWNGGERLFGMNEVELEWLIDDAELLINISGDLEPDSPLMRVPRRAYIDVDPGFTQVWAHEVDLGLAHHNFFFSTGQNVGRPGFEISTRGIPWQPILPPVVLDEWPARIDERCKRFSTVADWRGSQNARWNDEDYGGKRDQFVRFIRLPIETEQRFELALTIGQYDHEDLGLLSSHGWKVRNPYGYAGDPESYREFIQYSRAEFSVGKQGYIRSRSGWVSDRTACYLASGKPALVQSTGFEGGLPVGNGLLTFSTLEEAVAGVRRINEDYLAHCYAARRIAEEHFDSDKVLGFMLDTVGLT